MGHIIVIRWVRLGYDIGCVGIRIRVRVACSTNGRSSMGHKDVMAIDDGQDHDIR